MTTPAPLQLRVQAPQAAGQPETLELLVYGYITDSAWNDSDVDVKAIVRQLSEHPCATSIVVRVNSFGGDAFSGLALYNALKAHPAPKTVIVEGIAASAASIIAMAGRVRMATGAMLMIHGPSSFAGGTASEVASVAEGLEKLRDSLVDVYQAKTNLGREKLVELLGKDTWLTAAEAKELGFADEIDEAMTVTPTARGGLVFLNSVGFPADRMPPHLAAAGGSAMNEKALIAALKALMGLPETATNEEVLSAYNKVATGQPAKAPEKEEPEPAPMPAPGATAAAEQLTAICTVLATDGKALSPEAALAEVLRLRTVQPPMVDLAVAEGRITPAEAKVLRPLEAVAPEQLRALLAAKPKNSAVPLGPRQASPEKTDSATGPVITAEVKKAAELSGVAPEKIAARLAKQG